MLCGLIRFLSLFLLLLCLGLGFASFPLSFLFYCLEVYEHVVDIRLRREFSCDVLHGLCHAELSECAFEC